MISEGSPREILDELMPMLQKDQQANLRLILEKGVSSFLQEHRALLSDEELVAIAGGYPPNLSEFNMGYVHPETGAWSPQVRLQHQKPSQKELLLQFLAQEGHRRDVWQWRDASHCYWLLKPEEKRDAPTLIAKLTDTSPQVRAAAAKHLGDLASAESVKGLVAALDHEDAAVREAAARGLRKLRRHLRSDEESVSAIEAALDHHRASQGPQGTKLP